MAKQSDWSQQRRWVKIGYILTGLWILFILYETKADSDHELFNYIFLVPLGGWIAGMLLVRFLGLGKPPGND